MRYAQAYVKGPSWDPTDITIDLTYFDWADNTWYCASGGRFGATSGTWWMGRQSGSISFYSNGEMIAAGDSFAMPDWYGYPFNDTFLNRASILRIFKADAAWSFSQYASFGLLTPCTWGMTRI